MKIPELILPTSLKPRLSQGHPWVYRNQLGDKPPFITNGTWVMVRCGNYNAYGIWDANGPIAVRVFSRFKVPDKAWLRARLSEAWDVRAPIRERQQTNAYRLVFGEGDGIPGITIDLYGQYAVLQTYSSSLELIKPAVLEALPEIAQLKGILEKRRQALPSGEEMSGGRSEGGSESNPARVSVVWGRRPPRELVIEEHGLKFRADLFEGQKTGLFLDHRENRRLLQDWCEGKRVLNLFSYTGAFSLYAARGGASEITSCDVAAEATAEASRNFTLNGYDADRYEFLAEDCFELLESYGQTGRKFDVIVLDPPSFAHSKKNVFNALRGYTRLNTLALKCLDPGGLLVSASCTSYVSPEMFREMLSQAAQNAGKRLLLLHEAGQPLDHPVPAHFLEGRYLKFTLSRVQALI